MAPRMLVAGVGNIFFGDDGFGVEVVKRLAAGPLPEWVRVRDFGIRGIHLAYDLLDGAYETVVLVDAAPRGGRPGTLYLIEPDVEALEADTAADAHGMHPAAVFAMLKSLGGTPGRVLIVGCEPQAAAEENMGLSPPVEDAVDEAVRMVRELIAAVPCGEAAQGGA